MTDKQKAILTKYLNDSNMKKLQKMDQQTQYMVCKDFIDLILHMRWYHRVCGEMCLVPYFMDRPEAKCKEEIERIINQNRKNFGLAEDEYATVVERRYLDDDHAWYVAKQTWFKGMSETPTSHAIMVKYSPREPKCYSSCEFADV